MCRYALMRECPTAMEPGVDESEVLRVGIDSLTRVDAWLCRGAVERRLSNPRSLLRGHVPRDGVVASTLDFVGRRYLLWAWLMVPGIVLVDLHSALVVTVVGWIMISVGAAFFIGAMV